MPDRVHVRMELELFVDDQEAMRQAAFDRMQSAWSSEDAFPFDSASDVPLGQAVQSLLADALPLEVPGGRRSRLDIEAEEVDSDREGEESDEKDSGDDSDEKDDQDGSGEVEDPDDSTKDSGDGNGSEDSDDR